MRHESRHPFSSNFRTADTGEVRKQDHFFEYSSLKPSEIPFTIDTWIPSRHMGRWSMFLRWLVKGLQVWDGFFSIQVWPNPCVSMPLISHKIFEKVTVYFSYQHLHFQGLKIPNFKGFVIAVVQKSLHKSSAPPTEKNKNLENINQKTYRFFFGCKKQAHHQPEKKITKPSAVWRWGSILQQQREAEVCSCLGSFWNLCSSRQGSWRQVLGGWRSLFSMEAFFNCQLPIGPCQLALYKKTYT